MRRKETNRRGFLRRLAFALSCLLALAFALMWVAGMFTYTSVGVDHDEVEGERVLAAYYRVRWPGDGSFWIGAAAHYRPLADAPPDAFDLASTFFDRPNRPLPRNFCNRIGFWLVSCAADDPFNPAAVWSGWLAVPGWLPILVFGSWPIVCWLRRRRTQLNPPPHQANNS